MPEKLDTLLDVWREVGRHFEIGESVDRIAAAVGRHLPLGVLTVRRLDLQRGWLETVAVSPAGQDRQHQPQRGALGPKELGDVLAWGRRGTLQRRELSDDVGTVMIPADDDTDCVCGPLRDSEGLTGVLILAARRGAVFNSEHEAFILDLLEPIAVALENDRRMRELAVLRETAEADKQRLLTRLGRKELAPVVVGADNGLRPVMQRVEMVAASDVPVLLLGETGTGKEVVARCVHDRSARHDGPFIRVNCGAIPPELIDSQLFGHERGSFTGAVDTHKGWFERADGGTLFLDEVAELPLAAQVRLLRVLQDGFIERVGGKKSLHVDVRVVAATHRDMAALIREGRFREDLWYRVAVFPIAIPPLRERTEDVAALACHFAEKAATRFGLPLVMPTPLDVRRLCAYPWPGNVRELGTVIDRAALLGDGVHLAVETALGIAPQSSGPTPAKTRPPAPATEDAPEAAPAPRRADLAELVREVYGVNLSPVVGPDANVVPLGDVMRRHIESALRATHGRVEGPFGAAKQLGINPHTLRARMRKLGIDWRRYRASNG